MKQYTCSICGYIHNGEVPEDFRCPICKAGKSETRKMPPITAKAEPEAFMYRPGYTGIISCGI